MRSPSLSPLFAVALAALSCWGCATRSAQVAYPRGGTESGLATWYGAKFAGKRTASGEPFDPRAYTAAHRTLPFGTWVEVRRLDDGRRVRVRINDRGPYGGRGRIIDLSQAAAEALGMIRDGVVRVTLRVLR